MFKNLSNEYNKNLEKMINELSQKSIFNLDLSKLDNPRETVQNMIFFIYDIKDIRHFIKLSKKRRFNDKNQKLLFLSDDENDMPELYKIQEKIILWLENNYIKLLAETVRNDEEKIAKYNITNTITDQDLITLIAFTENGFDQIPYKNFSHPYNLLNLFRNGNKKMGEKLQNVTDKFRNLESVFNNKSPINILSTQCPNYLIKESQNDLLELVSLIRKNHLNIFHLKNESEFYELSKAYRMIENQTNQNQSISIKPNQDISSTMTFKQKIFLLDFSNYSLKDILDFDRDIIISLFFSQYNRVHNMPIIINVNEETYHNISEFNFEKNKKTNTNALRYFLYNSHSNIMKI